MGMCLHVSVCLSVCLLCFRLCVVCVCVCVLKRLIHACGENVWREEGERLGLCTRWRWCLIVDGCYV